MKDIGRIARACGLIFSALCVSTLTVSAADDTNKVQQMAPIVVTGSLIPTAETVGPAPVDTISPVEIQKTGSQDVLAVLKALTPGFSGGNNVGQSLNNGGFGEAYVALRNLPTLVLIDGQRVNITPFSTFVNTFAADLNTIPVAMIERIEVLKDGASTVYGSDAIGGVINIITKKDFNGAEVSGRYGTATGKGSYNEYRGSAVVGYSKNGTRLVIGADYYHSDPLLTGDRKIASMDANALAAAGLNPPTYFSGNYPGRIDSYLLAGSDLAKGAAGYIAGLKAPPIVAGGPFASVDDYNAAAAAAGYTVNGTTYHQNPYIPITDTPTSQTLGGATAILNTTLLGTISIQEQDRRSFFANFEHDFQEGRITPYAQFLYSHSESSAKLAPAPLPSLGSYNLFVPANNPYNPFGIDLGAGGSSDPNIRARLIETGNRSFETTSDFYHGVGGLKGNLADDYHYDVSVDYSRTSENQIQNSASSLLLNQAMTPFSGNLSQLVDSHGNHVPIYNYFALPGVNDPATLNAIRAKDGQGGLSELFAAQGVFRAGLFSLPAGRVQLAAGAQYVHETLNTTAGALLASGNLIGLNAVPPYPGGSREREAGFLEAQIPLIRPEQNFRLAHRLDLNASGRFETISSPGNSHNSLVPKVGIKWQPFDDQLTIRGTYSQGFNVPALTQLYGTPINGFPTLVAPYPDGSGGFDQVAGQLGNGVNYLSNVDTPPSTAETFTLGAVYSPKQVRNLTVSVDYYHILQPTLAYYPSGSAIIADLNQNGAASKWVNHPALHGTPIYLDVDGNSYVPTAGDSSTWILADPFGQLNLPLLSDGSQRTDGLDFNANYLIETKDAGNINVFVNANLSLSWDIRLGRGTPWLSYNGQYTDAQAVAAAQGMIPDYNISTGFTWSFHNFEYTVLAHYLPSAIDLGDLHKSVGAPYNDFTSNGQAWKISDYYKLDMQLAYTFRSANGKRFFDDTRVSLGINNVTDTQPRLIASSSEDNTDKSSYDILGRFIYVELSKKF